MIIYKQGNLLDAQVEALVNPVNTVGVMGKGLALQFKQRYPGNFELYRKACKDLQVQTGNIFVTRPDEGCAIWIVNFPTKHHWRDPSKIEWITKGLIALRDFIILNEVTSIALPMLGCGNGGLPFELVQVQIDHVLGGLDDVCICIYVPKESAKLPRSFNFIGSSFDAYLQEENIICKRFNLKPEEPSNEP